MKMRVFIGQIVTISQANTKTQGFSGLTITSPYSLVKIFQFHKQTLKIKFFLDSHSHHYIFSGQIITVPGNFVPDSSPGCHVAYLDAEWIFGVEQFEYEELGMCVCVCVCMYIYINIYIYIYI